MKKKTIRKFFNRWTCLYFLAFSIFIVLALSISARLKQKADIAYLRKEINLQVSNLSGDYSLAIYKPGIFGFEFSYKPDQKIAAASLIKLSLLAVCLEAVQDNYIDFDRKVVITSSDIAGGSGIFKRVDLPLNLNFKELVSFMIIISDNTATNKVIDLLGMEYINGSFAKFGLKDTILKRKMMDFTSRKMGFENYTSSRDTANILKKIYQNQLVNKEFSLFARNLLSRQQYRDRIVRFLPKGIEVAHKTGLERGVVHDAGIVYGEKSDFIICVLTKGVKNYKKAKEFIANVSQISYNLLN